MILRDREDEIRANEAWTNKAIKDLQTKTELLRKKVNHLEALIGDRHYPEYCDYCKLLRELGTVVEEAGE